MSDVWDGTPDPWPEFNPLLDIPGIDPSDSRHYSGYGPYEGIHEDGKKIWDLILEDAAIAGLPVYGLSLHEVTLFCGRCTFANNKGRKKPVKKPIGILQAMPEGWRVRTGDRYGWCPDARVTITCPKCGFCAWVSADDHQLTGWFLSHSPRQWRKQQSLDYLVKKGLAQEEADPWANPPVTTPPF